MKAIDRIKMAGEEASEAHYKEQRGTDDYNELRDLRKHYGLMKEDVADNESGINYLMAEVSALRAMVEELARMLDAGEE